MKDFRDCGSQRECGVRLTRVRRRVVAGSTVSLRCMLCTDLSTHHHDVASRTVLNPRPFLVLFVSALPGVVQKEGENLEYLGGQDCLPLFL